MNYAQHSRRELINEIKKLQQENNQLKEFVNKIELTVGEGKLIVAQCDQNLRYEWIYNSHSDFSDDEVIAKRDDELNQGSGIDELMNLKRTVLETGQKIRREITFPLSEEEVVYYVIAKPVYDNQQKVVGVFTASIDVTEFKKVQQQIIQNEKNQMMRQLALGISHQINNILAVIMGCTELVIFEDKVDRSQLSKNSVKMLYNIKKQCNKAKRLIFDLNSMAENNVDRSQNCLITDLLDKVLNNFNWEEEKIDLQKNYELSQKIKVDKNKLQRALNEIIINAYQAIKADGQGKVIVRVTETEKMIKVEIKDTGIGMSEEVQAKVFLPLYTTKGEWGKDNNKIKGVGLGLTIAEKIIQDHHGEIKVESQAGQGSSFIIELPLN